MIEDDSFLSLEVSIPTVLGLVLTLTDLNLGKDVLKFLHHFLRLDRAFSSHSILSCIEPFPNLAAGNQFFGLLPTQIGLLTNLETLRLGMSSDCIITLALQFLTHSLIFALAILE
jgi:hypothetical protein